MGEYRRIRVDIYPGRAQTLIAVTAETVRGGRRDVRLVHRAAVDLVDAATVAALLRVAGDECHDAADRLI
jgi:hypothetical protein